MLSCWQVDPDQRPTFQEICLGLMRLVESANAENYLDMSGDVHLDTKGEGSDGEEGAEENGV